MKSDEESLHSWFLVNWISILRRARADYERLARHISEGDGEGILPDEPLMVRFEPVSPEMWDFLLQGLERAARGEPDPFRLVLRHRKPKFSRVERAAAVAEAIRLHDKGIPLEEARAIVGDKKGVSSETIKKWFADDGILDEAASMVASDRHPKADFPLYWEERLNVVKRYRRHR